MIHNTTSLGRHLLIRILLVSSIITLILSLFQLFRDYSIDTDFIDTRLEQIERTRLGSIKENLWTLNRNVLNIELENLFHIQDVSYVALYSDKGHLISEFGEIKKEDYRTLEIPINYLYENKNYYLGNLIVKTTLESVYRRLQEKVYIIIVSQAFKTFLVSAFILFFIFQLVTDPLKRLTQYVERLKNKELDKTARELKPILNDDEFFKLSETFTNLHTQLVKQYKELEQSTNNFKQIFERSNDAIVVTDINTMDVLEVNTKASEFLEYSLDELKNMNAKNIHPDNASELELFLKEVIEKGSSVTSRLNCLTKNGHHLPVEISASLIMFAGKNALLAIVRDISEQRKTELKMRHMAYHDALTQLPNRNLFNLRLEHMMARSIRHKTHGGLIFLDLDKFKDINDSLGHSIGDKLLINIADRIRSFLREEESIARIGGDEFVFLLADDHDEYIDAQNHTIDMVTKLYELVQKEYNIDNNQLNITFSAGIAIYPDDGKTVDDLLRRSDSAMYKAKREGGSNLVVYHASLDKKLKHQLLLENELKTALENNEFYLVYQPKLNPILGELIGAEVLLRWENKTLGNVSPVDFIPVLEKNGQILDVGRWVIQKSCEQWQQAIMSGEINQDMVLAINASAKQFQSEVLKKDLDTIIKETGINPWLIEIEITEESMVSKFEKTSAQMEQLSQLGISIALDDFGTGYSSLSYLHRLPVNTLKIDRSFIKQVPGDPRLTILLSSIIQMAHKLNLKIVAEGVETEIQQDYLIEHMCDLVQGFYYSKPVVWDEFIFFQNTLVKNIA